MNMPELLIPQTTLSTILEHFNLDDGDYLGSGVEGHVYALSDEQIIKIYGPDATLNDLEELQKFYASLKPQHRLHFPKIISIQEIGGVYVTVDKRLGHMSVHQILKTLEGRKRRACLDSYLSRAADISKTPYQADYYGEILGATPARNDTWHDFLIDKAQVNLENCFEKLSRDVPDLDKKMEAWREHVMAFFKDNKPEKSLVHGDYYPGNILSDDQGKVTAATDFSTLTVVGDWHIDIVGAVIFMETEPDTVCTTQDIAYVRDKAISDYNITPEEIDIYRGYYSLLFAHTCANDPALYKWCASNINNLTYSSGSF